MGTRERQYQRVGKSLSVQIQTNGTSERDNIKGSLNFSTNKYKQMAQQEREISKVVGNPLFNKYKQNGTKRETISKEYWTSLCPINTNKWHKQERDNIKEGHWKLWSNKCKTNKTRERDNIKGHWKPLSNKYKQNGTRGRDNISKRSLEILCPINTNKWNKRERQYQRKSLKIPLSNKYKQMAQERETISKGHWKSFCPINKRNVTRGRETISKVIGNSCPINTNQIQERETISKVIGNFVQ
ncbi:unnamed protein product [Mytilus edulis]|uniref:Uncharacterized protein n=1 Tax=Mytilus edulis TaxID=6550 RepID=A0A8S3URF6_MYTED|nr:unnamed protein product [Mytilus edulis]